MGGLFLAGVYLTPWWSFPALLGEAVVLDYFAVTWRGVDRFCFTPAYAFLLPAYATRWYAGRWFGKPPQTIPGFSLRLTLSGVVPLRYARLSPAEASIFCQAVLTMPPWTPSWFELSSISRRHSCFAIVCWPRDDGAGSADPGTSKSFYSDASPNITLTFIRRVGASLRIQSAHRSRGMLGMYIRQ